MPQLNYNLKKWIDFGEWHVLKVPQFGYFIAYVGCWYIPFTLITKNNKKCRIWTKGKERKTWPKKKKNLYLDLIISNSRTRTWIVISNHWPHGTNTILSHHCCHWWQHLSISATSILNIKVWSSFTDKKTASNFPFLTLDN